MAILTTSGTYTFSQSAVEIINAALRLTQVIGDEETATASQLQSTMDAMGAMVKGWQGSGIHVWCEEEGILFLQPGQVLYQIGAGSADHVALFEDVVFGSLATAAVAGAGTVTLTSVAGIDSGDTIGVQLDAGTNYWTTVSGAPSGNVVTLGAALPSAASAGAITFDYPSGMYRPLKVMGGRRYQYLSRIDIPIQMWARLEYQAQPNKYTPGVTTAFFYDPQIGQGAYSTPFGQMNVWPNPADNTFAMRFTAQRPIQDVGTLASTPDFPIEWNAALKWNLAMEIGPEFGVPAEQLTVIKSQADKWYDMAARWDRESESLRFGVAMQPGYRRG